MIRYLIKNYLIVSKDAETPLLSREERAILRILYKKGMANLAGFLLSLNMGKIELLRNLHHLQRRQFVFFIIHPFNDTVMYGITEAGRTEVEMFSGR